jgi:hypothetical protein
VKALKLHIPKSSESEAKYVFTILLKDILGCDIEFETVDSPHYSINSEEKRVEIRSDFFREKSFNQLYTSYNIPNETSTNSIEIDGANFLYETIYGEPEVDLSKSNTVIHFDIVGSAFFMLTRWEEAASDETDQFGRYNAEKALSVSQGFYQRPVVNEYAEILYAILKYMDFNVVKKNYVYESVATFDIDQIRKWFSFKQLLISIKDNLLEGKINHCLQDVVSYANSRKEVKDDPYCNFDNIVSSLKKNTIKKAIFYFKALQSESKYDRNKYSLNAAEIQSAFRVIEANNFEVGIHPGFLTFDNPKLMGEEVEALKKYSGQNIKAVRQHYLRFKTPHTWRHQSSNELSEDSTMIYPHEAGFRNGICQPFQVYDFEKRSLMHITEMPLLFMETPYLLKRDKLIEDLTHITTQVKKYGGVNTILWHNSNIQYGRDSALFNKALKIISST